MEWEKKTSESQKHDDREANQTHRLYLPGFFPQKIDNLLGSFTEDHPYLQERSQLIFSFECI